MQTSKFSTQQVYEALMPAREAAFGNGDRATLDRISRIITILMSVGQLLQAFDLCSGRIAGPKGVQGALGFQSRNAVYKRLTVLGLSKSDFMQQGVTIGYLMLKSNFGSEIREWLEES